MNRGRILPAVALLAVSVTAASCSRDESTSDAPAAAAAPLPAPPEHHWIIKENGEYGYSQALSEEDRAAGRGAAEVVMFQYLGETGGIYRIASTQGTSYIEMSCSNPCKVVKAFANSDVPLLTTHMVFNPETVMGEAFTDAFSGQLDVYGSEDGKAPIVRPPVAIGTAKTSFVINGKCIQIVARGDDLSNGCGTELLNITDLVGRTTFTYVLANGMSVGFGGDAALKVRNAAGQVSQPIDLVIFSTGPAGVPAKTIRAIGSCAYTDPYKGAAQVNCDVRSDEGTFTGRFSTDGRAPSRLG